MIKLGTGTTYNIRKGFIGKEPILTASEFSDRYDEPTYLTFKLDFYSDERLVENTLYDSLPQALFTIPSWTNTDNKQLIGNFDPLDLDPNTAYSNGSESWASDEWANRVKSYITRSSAYNANRKYSAIEYLLQRNEDYRAFYLACFIKGWNDLQDEYQFYFQEISGLSNLFAQSTDKGQKIEQSAAIKVKCLEGIDQKVKYLLSLYRAAAWDDHYQRWILPEVYRWFKLDIYISEVRTFHQSNFANQGSFASLASNLITGLANKIVGKIESKVSQWTKGALDFNAKLDAEVLSIISGFCPVTKIHCEMCDFNVIENLFNDSYSINNDSMEETTFEVKVRKAEIIHNWLGMSAQRVANLISRSEREIGPSQYAGNFPLTQDEDFNNAAWLAESDRSRSYTEMLKDGWLNNILDSAIGAFTNKNNTALDIAADLYQGIRDGIARKKADEDNNVLSKANSYDNDIPESMKNNILEAIGTRSTANSNEAAIAKDLLMNVNNTFDTLRQEEQQMVQNQISKIAGALQSRATPELSGSTGEQNLKNTGFEEAFKIDRSISTELDGGPGDLDNGEIHDAIQREALSEANDDDTKLTLTLTGAEPGKANWVPVDMNIDRSTATELDGGPGSIEFGLTGADVSAGAMAGLDMNIDRSTATDLDGGPGNITLELSGNEAGKGPMSGLDMNIDRSTATELDGGPGSINLSLTGGDPGNASWQGLYMNIDRSTATELDGGPGDVANGLDMNIDRSTATELDGGPGSIAIELSGSGPGMHSMTGLDMNIDRSWATDLDGGPGGIVDNGLEDANSEGDEILGGAPMVGLNTDIDRSTATELDGGPYYSQMPSVNQNVTIPASAMTGINQDIDRSTATELDGGPYYDDKQMPKLSEPNMPTQKMQAASLQQAIDRSTATELDGGPKTMKNASLFEQIAAKHASTATSGTIGESHVLVSNSKPQPTILENGIINPKAKVADVIEAYAGLREASVNLEMREIKLIDNSKKTQMTDFKLEGEKPKTKVVL